jgi:DNA-binding MarR family transcriptional regulator
MTDSALIAPGASRRPARPVQLWLRLIRVFQKMQRSGSDQMRCHGLSMAHFDVLANVGTREGMTQQELADSLLVTKGNICQLLDRLEMAGLIERRQDGRANHLFLTAEGRDLFDRAVPAHEAMIAERLSVLEPQEQEELLRLLRKLDQNLT